MIDKLIAAVVVLVILLVVGFLVVALLVSLTPWQCDRIAAVNVDLEFTWSLATGCMVRMPDGIWYHVSRVEYVGLEAAP